MALQTYFHRVTEQTPTRFWINNVTRHQADLALEAGAVGCTQNPSYVWKMLSSEDESEAAFARDKMKSFLSCSNPDEIETALQRKLVEEIAKKFLPLYEKTHGKQGYVSVQGNPFREDTESIIRYAEYNTANFPNIMAKIPATENGFKAIEYLIAERIPMNVTEVMSVAQAMDVCETYGKVVKKIKSPAPLYFSHIAGIFDEEVRFQAEQNDINISSDMLWQAGISVAKKIYRMTKEFCSEIGFVSGGARGLHHFTEMVGADACITINWKGTADKLIDENPPVVQRFFAPTPESTIDKLCEKLEVYRKAYMRYELTPAEYESFAPVVRFRNSFETAWTKARALIERGKDEYERGN